ncbi:hypothetical protein D3C84_406500 [compost metagenome]
MAHQDRLAVAHHQQLGRQGAVEGPHRIVVLHRHFRVDADVDALGGAFGGRNTRGVVVEAIGAEFALGVAVHLLVVTQAQVEPCTGLHGLERGLGVELVPALVRPALAAWPSFGGRAHRGAVEEGFDLRLPGVAVQHVGVLGGERGQPRLAQKGFQGSAGRAAAGNAVGVLAWGGAHSRDREGHRRRRGLRVEFLRAELFEQQDLLGIGFGTEQRAGLAVGGVVERGLLRRLQDVFGTRRVAVAEYTVGQGQGAMVGFGQGSDFQQGGSGVGRFGPIVGRVGRRWLALIVDGHRAGVAHRDGDQQRRRDARAPEESGCWVGRSDLFHLLRLIACRTRLAPC